ncbi:hypothetical protein [uncultured Mediterranean phage uvDeep-CGR2-KM19-C269]|nr:hypothetical protein [uncultured Mediterranean phage uvDeep-CGR2-KM19-C269]
MNVIVNINSEKKEYELINSWNDVSLKELGRLLEYRKLSPTAEAINTINMFSDIPKDVIKKLRLEDVLGMLSILSNMEEDKDTSFKATFTLHGVKYGFIPSLEDISLGEYADIETFIKNGIENNLANIMSVLFRPVVEDHKDYYIIEGYDATTQQRRSRLFMDMSGIQVQNAMVFFCNFVNELYKTFPSYLITKMRKQTETSQ